MTPPDAPRPGTLAARRARDSATKDPSASTRPRRPRPVPVDESEPLEDIELDVIDPGTPPHGAPAARDETTAFLLQSLRDLEREHAVGDLDDADYATLRDEYTSRAAVALRAEERGKAPPVPRKDGRSPLQWGLALAAVIGFAVLAGVLMAQASGQRKSGGTITGEITRSPTQIAGECLNLSAQVQAGAASPQQALDCYQGVLDDDPENAVARTYLGWTLFLTARAGAEDFGEAELVELYVQARRQVELGAEADPGYPDARAFLVVLAVQSGEYEEAAKQLEAFDELDAPADMASLVDTVRSDIEAGLSGDTTTTTTTAPS